MSSCFEFKSKDFKDSVFNNGGKILNRLWHAKGNHGSERQVKSIFLSEKIGPTKDEAEAKVELFLASIVEGGNE
jgi:hypothetical protein